MDVSPLRASRCRQDVRWVVHLFGPRGVKPISVIGVEVGCNRQVVAVGEGWRPVRVSRFSGDCAARGVPAVERPATGVRGARSRATTSRPLARAGPAGE